tara:strand:+ start:433 stop:909 length:477 start_codon:yes stop_codon:yes gene_type:complete
MEEDYQVGQIIFLIGEKTTRVIPIQVVEEVVRTTVEGKIKTYTVQMPDKKQTKADIYSLKGTLFKNTGDLHNYMLTNAKNAISAMVEDAVSVSEEVFKVLQKHKADPNKDVAPLAEEQKAAPSNTLMQSVDDDGIIRVDLGDGKIAKMKSTAMEQPTK